MADMMTFPDTVEEFMEEYKLVDTEQVYTNGTALVPIFRMKQWFEHEKAQLSQQGTTKGTTSELPTIQPEERTEECTKTHSCDLIDRHAAQTELMMKCERYTLARESHGMGNVEWSSDLISVADAMDAIRDLPPAQPEPQWIPVSERLPEEHESMFAKYYNTPKWNNSMWLKESDKMLVSVEVPGNEIIVDIAKMLDGKWFFGLSFVDKKVIAWMPLPEAYKPNK